MAEILCIIDGMTDPTFCTADYPNLASMRLMGYQDHTLGGEPETLNPYFSNRGVNHKFALLTVPESYRNYNGSKWSNTSKSGSFPPEKALENFPIAANFTGS